MILLILASFPILEFLLQYLFEVIILDLSVFAIVFLFEFSHIYIFAELAVSFVGFDLCFLVSISGIFR